MSIINGSASSAINANNSEGESMGRNGRGVKLDESGVRRLVREMLSETDYYRPRDGRSKHYGTHGYADVYGVHDEAQLRGMPDDQRIADALAFLGPEDEAAFTEWYITLNPELGKNIHGRTKKNGDVGTPKELAQKFMETPPVVTLGEAALRRLVRGILRESEMGPVTPDLLANQALNAGMIIPNLGTAAERDFINPAKNFLADTKEVEKSLNKFLSYLQKLGYGYDLRH
jgi:hypothetical protein